MWDITEARVELAWLLHFHSKHRTVDPYGKYAALMRRLIAVWWKTGTVKHDHYLFMYSGYSTGFYYE